MKLTMPGGLTSIGGILLAISSFVCLAIGINFGLFYYGLDPNGLFGHVGIIAG